MNEETQSSNDVVQAHQQPAYTSARSPKWANAEKTAIELRVTFPAFGEVPFGASPNDVVEYGRELFYRARNGDFGPVAPYEPPTSEQLAQMARTKRDRLLAEAAIRIAPLQDAVDLGEATPEEATALTAWKRYRIALNRIEDQAGFPRDIQWPAAPA